MSNHHVKYVLVGGGLASSAAARAIRERDAEGSAMLVGQEINRPYHRPPLSKEYLRREKPHSELFTLEAHWFEANRVELRTARRASHLDTARKALTLDNGEEISFDKLLIATGAMPAPLNVPGGHLPNVYYLRTVEDADRLHNAVDKAKREGIAHPRGRGRAAVIGAGVLGVELAASLTQLGLAIDLLVAHTHPWNKFAGESTGRFLELYLQKHGINIHTHARTTALEGDGRVQRVRLADGRSIECDFAVAAVGAIANKELLRGTPISAGKAILVDDHCRTSEPDIYAAGDCAAVFDPLFAKHRMLDHWDNANVTGALAGANMAGADQPYRATNYFFSDVFDLSISAWGEARLVDRRLSRGTHNTEAPDFVEIGIAADGRIAQVIAVGHKGEDELLRELVAQRVRVDGNEESLKDPATPLQSLIR